MGLLETIRAAVAGPGETVAAADPVAVEANLNPPSGATMEAAMADNTVPGAVTTGISEADHKAAVSKAEAEGRVAGRKEANDRMATILAAEGIKGDGRRMAAALDLAQQSADMAAEGVIAFVAANIPAGKPSAANTYEEQRLLAGGLTRSGGDKPAGDKGDTSILAAAVARTNKRR